MASIDSGSQLEARALEFVKDAEKQLEEDAKKTALLKRALAIEKDAEPEKKLEEAAKKTALLNEKLGKEAQAFDQDLRKKLDLYKPWLTFDQDLMRKLNLMKKGQKSQILLVEGVQYFDSLSR